MKHGIRLSIVALVCLCLVAGIAGAQDLPSASPASVGMSAERLERIDTVMERFIAESRIAGMVTMIARHGKLVHCEAYGKMDIEENMPMKVDALFRVASMSKLVTAVAGLILYEEGRFLLDDPVSRYIPAFKDMRVFVPASEGGSSSKSLTTVPAKREITVRMLFNHTSGFTYGTGEVGKQYSKAGIGMGLTPTEGTIGDMVAKLAKQPLLFHPGDRWEYGLSNDVLGYFIEIVSGMRLDAFCRERIFEPLEMNDSGFYFPDYRQDDIATLYRRNRDGEIKRIPPEGLLGPKTDYFSGGAGLIMSASDYLRFGQMLLYGGELDGVRILSRTTVELMSRVSESSPYIWEGRDGVRSTHGDQYALGVGVRTNPDDLGSPGTYGWGGAYHTHVWIDPKEDMVGVFMSQLGGGDIRRHHREFKILAYQAIDD